ncbi:methyltransferase domain-containing protein [Methylobacterium sp. CM6246]
MNRRDLILQGLDIKNLRGLELGPLSKPLVRRSDGLIYYVDHAPLNELKTKYGVNQYYDLNDFVNVDIVWNGGSLQEAIGSDIKIDYIVASHVIEHVPNLIDWLRELSSVLADGGEIRLAIPDKRFIFDYYRQVTQVAEVLGAWIRKDKTPGPNSIIDYMINAINADANNIWNGIAPSEPVVDSTLLQVAFETANKAFVESAYLDAHCWVFTPKSFADLMRQISGIGAIWLKCQNYIPTRRDSIEFYVSLAIGDSREENAKSWAKAHDLAQHWMGNETF